jgi:hypothetical protein
MRLSAKILIALMAILAVTAVSIAVKERAPGFFLAALVAAIAVGLIWEKGEKEGR